uniref:Uncharacterized protein n=1 Tax=uncultured marine virus TaxID=186617 RepID=A0A0F7L9B9_9VIRU|nr:hypothetical protein [uncultured marine virus]
MNSIQNMPELLLAELELSKQIHPSNPSFLILITYLDNLLHHSPFFVRVCIEHPPSSFAFLFSFYIYDYQRSLLV